jgi:transcriptional regulator with XRE-family HTH domain
MAHRRKEIRISQKVLAEAAGVSSTMISRYETGQREPSITVLINIAKVLNTTSDILLGLEPRPDSIAQNRDEYNLLQNFRNLNILGQGKLLDYSSDLGDLPRYVEKRY